MTKITDPKLSGGSARVNIHRDLETGKAAELLRTNNCYVCQNLEKSAIFPLSRENCDILFNSILTEASIRHGNNLDNDKPSICKQCYETILKIDKLYDEVAKLEEQVKKLVNTLKGKYELKYGSLKLGGISQGTTSLDNVGCLKKFNNPRRGSNGKSYQGNSDMSKQSPRWMMEDAIIMELSDTEDASDPPDRDSNSTQPDLIVKDENQDVQIINFITNNSNTDSHDQIEVDYQKSDAEKFSFVVDETSSGTLEVEIPPTQTNFILLLDDTDKKQVEDEELTEAGSHSPVSKSQAKRSLSSTKLHTMPNRLSSFKDCVDMIYKCSICKVDVKSKTEYDLHKEQHHPNGEKEVKIRTGPFPCPHCPKTFLRLQSLKRHSKLHPENNNSSPLLICHQCGKPFTDKYRLNCHLSTHEDPNTRIHHDKRYVQCKCTTCGKEYNCTRNLADHVKRVHEAIRPHICDQCAKTFYRKSGLDSHVKLKHAVTKEEKATCPQCGKKFDTMKARILHERRFHSDSRKDKIFKCGDDACGAIFISNFALRQHQKRHEREKVTCEICERQFEHASQLKRHKSSKYGCHQNDKKGYKCRTCGEVFTTGRKLWEHGNTTHGLGESRNDKREEFIPDNVITDETKLAVESILILSGEMS